MARVSASRLPGAVGDEMFELPGARRQAVLCSLLCTQGTRQRARFQLARQCHAGDLITTGPLSVREP